MKKTQIWGVNVRNVNTEIEELEADGWEVLSVQVLTVPSEYLRDTIYKVAYIIAQKEADKSIYEKMYLLEQYCSKKHCRSGKCRIENMCSEYQGNGSFLWDFNDVEKAYEILKVAEREEW